MCRSRFIPGMLAAIVSLGLFCMTGGTALALISHPALPAHAKVWKANPGIGSTVSQVPANVTVFTLENINPDPSKSSLQVYGPSADATDTMISQGNAQVSLSNPKEMSVAITPNKGHSNGVYVVFWKTVSAEDGDAAAGSFSFTINTSGTGTTSAQHGTTAATNNNAAPAAPIWVPIASGLIALMAGLGVGLGLGRRKPATSSLAAMRASISQDQKRGN